MRNLRVRAWLPALCLVAAGCGGTSPNLSAPQMQTPSLGGGAERGRSTAGLPRGAAAEANLPAPAAVKTAAAEFVALPYLQLGDSPRGAGLSLLWLAPPDAKPEDWSVETRPAEGGDWKKAGRIAARTVPAAEGVKPHAVWQVALDSLEPGALFDYRVLKGEEPVFGARARARRTSGNTSRVVVLGDTGAGTAGEKQIAYQVSLARPDYGVVTGDIVYSKGRASEYAANFWPIFNAETAAAQAGAPVLRTIPFVAAPGNHDVASTTLDKFADGFAYFYYWSQPLNGPALTVGQKIVPALGGTDTQRAAFLQAAGDRFPKMGTFSFDYGNVHWTVLDSNAYTDWNDPALVAWLEKDLSGAKKATWRFVVFHHPPFNSSEDHFENQWMRVLAPRFEKHKVAVVWSGHVHNYQRTHPLRFASPGARAKDGKVDGKLQIDTAFDGVKRTKPAGVLYVVTGAGGASLYKKVEGADGKLQPFTAKLVNDLHSLTVLDIDGKTLKVRQIAADGKEIDTFTVTQ